MAVIVLVWKDSDNELDAAALGQVADDLDPQGCAEALQLPTVLSRVEEIRAAGGHDIAAFVRAVEQS